MTIVDDLIHTINDCDSQPRLTGGIIAICIDARKREALRRDMEQIARLQAEGVTRGSLYVYGVQIGSVR